ncbi:MAG: PQQ-dependent sugar dehydrogenase [Ignavibacteriales bacterium]|nr:PQQ-dependent sugar dehydrogenase [Ignavibacteriales bacterium]
MKITALLCIVTVLPAAGFQERTFTTKDKVEFRVETVVAGLEIPWSLVFDPDGNLYFTERPGRLQVLRKGETKPELVAEISGVVHRGEGGLMGLALHPAFERNRFIYLSLTAHVKGDLSNKVVRYKLIDGKLADPSDVVPYLPASSVHNGCRIRFGPDAKLYVSTGDAADRELAQDKKSLAGKILRLNDDGSLPSDNPISGSAIFASGLRNPQGIDWHPTEKLLFETEHGPSGFDGPGGGDEVNIIDAGKNYGWPVIHHKMKKPGMESPLLEYSPAVAPASGAFYSGRAFPSFKNNFFFGCLRGQKIMRIIIDESNPRKVVRQEALLEAEFKRIRDIAVGPDGYIYFSTSNRDGRASPFDSDDRILRIVPAN